MSSSVNRKGQAFVNSHICTMAYSGLNSETAAEFH